MTWLIYDGVVVGILLISFFWCWHKGFVSSLVGLVTLAASAAVAVILSDRIAPLLYESFLKQKVEEALLSIGTQNAVSPWLQSLIQANGSAAEQVIINGLRVLAGIILFAVVFFLLSLVARIFRGLNQVPFLGAINRLLGGVLGLGIGLALCLVLATTAAILLLFSGEHSWLSLDIIDKTYLFSILYRYNLLVFL